MLAVLVAAVAYNPPGVDDAFLVGRVRAFGDSPSCLVQCPTDACWGLNVGDELVDAIIVAISNRSKPTAFDLMEFDHPGTINATDSNGVLIYPLDTGDLDNANREVTFAPRREISFNTTHITAVPTAAQLFGKVPACATPLEHVAIGSVRINASTAAAGSTRARFQLPVFLALADTFGAVPLPPDAPVAFDVPVMAARVVNTTVDAQSYMNPMPPVTGCDFQKYVCDPGLCTVIDINYQNFYEPDTFTLLERLNASGDVSFHARYDQNRLFGMSFCGPVFGTAIRATEDNKLSAPTVNESYYPTDVKVSFPPADRRDPFAGLRVTHGHSLEVLYPAWAPIGCNITEKDGFCQLAPSDRYGGLPFRQERITNNLPLYTAFGAKVGRVICPVDQHDLSLGYDVYNFSEDILDSLPLADICVLPDVDNEFFEHCCQQVEVNYVVSDKGTEYEGTLMYTPKPHTDVSRPVEFDIRQAPSVAFVVTERRPYASCPAAPNPIQVASLAQCVDHCDTFALYYGPVPATYLTVQTPICACMEPSDVALCSFGLEPWAPFSPGAAAAAKDGAMPALLRVKQVDSVYDNRHTVIGWSDTLLPCCPWWANATELPPSGREYAGAETCIQNVTEIVDYAVNNPEWLAACRVETAKTHDQTDWAEALGAVNINAFYNDNANSRTPIGDAISSTIMPIASSPLAEAGEPCDFDESAVISSKDGDMYSGLVANASCESSVVYRRVVIVNAHQGNDRNKVVSKPVQRVQAVVMMQSGDCLADATAWLTCRRESGQTTTYEHLHTWGVPPPPKEAVFASHVQPCNGVQIGFTPTLMAAYTGNDNWDKAKLGRTANDYQSVAYVDKAVLDKTPLAQAAMLMYGLEPDAGTLEHLSSVSNCGARFYNVNPHDAEALWIGEGRGGAGEKHADDDTVCAAATLSRQTNASRAYTFSPKACGDTQNPLKNKLAVGSVQTAAVGTAGLFGDDETNVVPLNTSTQATLSCETATLADIVKTYVYDTYASFMFWCAPGEVNSKCCDETVCSSCTGTDWKDCGSTDDGSRLNVMALTQGELIGGAGRSKTLSDPSGVRSMAARFSCKVTNEVGLMPELVAPLDSSDRVTTYCFAGSYKHYVCESISTDLPLVRRDPYSVFEGSALNDDPVVVTRAGNKHAIPIPPIKASSMGEGSWSTARYAAAHQRCRTAGPLGDRPVWHKGCVLSAVQSEVPVVSTTENTKEGAFPHFTELNPAAIKPDAFFQSNSPDAPTQFTVTPSWYPRARQFTGDYDGDTNNPKPVAGPARYVLDSLEFFGAAPTNISAMMVDAGPGLNRPNNGRFLKAPMPVKGAGAGPAFVPADYPRRPYIPSSDNACVCDRTPVWACISEGPEYWQNEKTFPRMHAECENQRVPLPNGTSPYKPPTCTAVLKKCGWSWQVGGTAIQGGVAGDIGLYIYGDRNGPIPVEERDPLGDQADSVFRETFLELWAPSHNVLKKLQSDSSMTARYTLPGPCVRAPFGKLHSHAMTADGIANTFFRTPGLVRDTVYHVGREALIGYCEAFEGGTKYQRCSGDRNDYDARKTFCGSNPHVNEIVMGWTVAERVSRCAQGTQLAVCIYFAYEPGIDTLQDVTAGVAAGLDVTIVVAPMAWTVVTEMQAGMFRYDIRQQGPKLHDFESGMFQNDPAFAQIPACGATGGRIGCRHQASDEQLRLVQDVALALVDSPESDWVDYTKATLDALYAAFDSAPFNTPVWNRNILGPEGQDCPAGQVLVPVSPKTSPTTYAACVSTDRMKPALVGRGHTLSLPNTTLTTATGGPIVMTATSNPNCNGIIVAAPDATIDVPLEIDQRLCPGLEATMMGVVFVGPDARNAAIANVTVVAPAGRQPAAVAALGYDSLYGTKSVVNVTGLVAVVNEPPGFAFAFAHAVADTEPNLGVASGPVTVLLQEAAAEHFVVSDEWETTNVTAFTSVFGWGYESKLYHQNTRAETVAIVAVAVGAAVGAVLLVLLGASLCVLRAERGGA